MFWFESTTCLSHHSRSLTSTSMQSEAYGTNMYRVLLFPYQSAVPILYPSIFLPMFRMSLPSIKTGLHPCSAPPTRDPPEFLSSSPSCALPATRVPPGGFAPAGAPPAPLPRTGTSTTAATGASRAERHGPSPAASRRRRSWTKSAPRAHRVGGACEGTWRKRARALGEGRRRDSGGRGLDEGKVGADFVEGVVGGMGKKSRRERKRGHTTSKEINTLE